MTYISAALRRLVIERASGCCEYCRMQVADRLLPFEVDHVIAEKHGGARWVRQLYAPSKKHRERDLCKSFAGSAGSG
jgi:hypothetical protein